MTPEHFDIIIVGSGLSGIGAAYRMQTSCPGKSYVILENRDAIGGTWDLFRYPGIRSDSDMFTFAIRSAPGNRTPRSPTANRSALTFARRPKLTASIARSASAIG